MKTPSFFSEHPWMTFFLGLAVVDGVVAIARGYPPRLGDVPQMHKVPLLPIHYGSDDSRSAAVGGSFAPHVRGTYK
jgi:hypothetical protein